MMIHALLAAAALVTGATLDAAASYPEGPLYSGGELLVAELGSDSVFAHRDGRKRLFFRQALCGPTALAPFGEGFVVLCHLSRELVIVDASGVPLRRIGMGEGGARFDDPNDCGADDLGGVYFSDPGRFAATAAASGEIWRLGPDGAVRRLASGLHYPNGVYFDQRSRRLLVSEHLARRILAFPVLKDGTLGEATVFADINRLTPQRGNYREAGPDGLEITPQGEVVVALYGEGRLLRLDQRGRLLGEVEVPFPYVTNVAFGRDGSGVAVGAFVNDQPPFLGAVLELRRVER